MPRFKITYVFEEEIDYASLQEATTASADAAKEFEATEGLILVKMNVEEV
jgi:hypothetical protein